MQLGKMHDAHTPGCPNHLVIKKETMTIKGRKRRLRKRKRRRMHGIKPSIVSEVFGEDNDVHGSVRVRELTRSRCSRVSNEVDV